MKILKPVLVLAALVLGSFSGQAQTDAKAKKEAKIAAIKQAIENRSFEFVPEYAHVDGTQDRLLEKDYTLVVKNGKIISHMPTAAYSGGLAIELNENKVNFESKKNDVTINEKKGGYNIIIKLKDCQEASAIDMNITPDGKYSSVKLLSYHVKPVNFTGHIRPIETTLTYSAE